MKKLLLFLSIIISTSITAQVLQSEDFNGMTVGNIGTDITGLTAGQNLWFTESTNGTAPTTSTNANNSNFQVVTTGFGSTNGLKIVSADGNKGSRFMWKEGLDTAWGTRTTGNEIIEVEYNFYTGPATTSTTQSGVRLYGLDGTSLRTLGGFVFTMNTKVLSGVAYLNNAGTLGTYLINLATGGLILQPDTWYRIGFAYDTTTGQAIWKADTAYTGLAAANWAGPFEPTEVDFVFATPTTNATSTDAIFDNLVVTAKAQESLLNVDENNISDKNISMFPNPTKHDITIKTNDNETINLVEIVDVNGRIVLLNKPNSMDANVDLSTLSSGIYMVKISTQSGTFTKKLIKE